MSTFIPTDTYLTIASKIRSTKNSGFNRTTCFISKDYLDSFKYDELISKIESLNCTVTPRVLSSSIALIIDIR